MNFKPIELIQQWHEDTGHKPVDAVSEDLCDLITYVLSKVTNLIDERAMTAERLTQYFAEYDNKMRSELRKKQREEPTTLVSVYLRNLSKDIRQFSNEGDRR